MEIHRPKAAHSWREFGIEIATIICGILIALALEQSIEWLHWRHEIAEARQALGREIAYNVKALQIMQGEDACMSRRLGQLALWARGKGPRPSEADHRPMFFTLATSTWDVVNSGQVVAHFPTDQKMQYAHAYASLVNERDTIAEERVAWQTIVSIAGDEVLDDASQRELRHAIGLSRTISQRRRGNGDLLLRENGSLAIAERGLPLPEDRFAAAFCRAVG